jgi:signal transduction histidine kinase
LNNAAKHSGGTVVRISLELEPHGVGLVVEDDGKGGQTDGTAAGTTREVAISGGEHPALRPTETPNLASAGRLLGGDGIANMRRRLSKVGGTFEIQCAPGKGTRVRFWVPVTNA